MPGFPDGSYGFHKIESLLQERKLASPRLYVEYVGQGDSDKPTKSKYKYSTMERADLVEAQWKAHFIQDTVLVTFDYSSLVMLELLQRQRERLEKGIANTTTIHHVLAVNGGLFADGHSHPWTTTPLLKTFPLGQVGTWMAQRSNIVFDEMLKPLYSKEYSVTRRELRETEAAIRRHNGANFLASAAGFVEEHKRHSKRWNLQTIYEQYARDRGITFHLVGSEQDQFEHKQITLAQQRLGNKYHGDVTIERIPGGHLVTSEQADKLASMIEVLAAK